jgi:uncharacterized protein (DUF433 family)
LRFFHHPRLHPASVGNAPPKSIFEAYRATMTKSFANAFASSRARSSAAWECAQMQIGGDCFLPTLPSSGLKGPDGRATFDRMTPKTAYRYLTNIPGVCGGKTIIEGTRIGVHDVIGLIVNGDTVDDVVRSFPDLKRSQVFECLAYYEDHRAEIDSLVAEQMSDPNA